MLYDEGFTISGARHRLDVAVEQATKSNASKGGDAASLRKEIESVLESLR